MPRTPNSSPQTQALLQALMGDPKGWRHGYDLSKEMGLKSGTLYPILMRLSDQGFLEAKWVAAPEPSRPARHAYRLTAKGQVLARETLRRKAPRRARREAPA